MSDETTDTKLIECERCKAVINGVSFWVKDGTAEIICEECHAAESNDLHVVRND